MKASELIAELQKKIGEHWDLDVRIFETIYDEYDWDRFEEVEKTSIEVVKNHDMGTKEYYLLLI